MKREINTGHTCTHGTHVQCGGVAHSTFILRGMGRQAGRHGQAGRQAVSTFKIRARSIYTFSCDVE